MNRNLIQGAKPVLFLIMISFALSLSPSLTVPYLNDDIDHFHNVARAIRSSTMASWLLTPHNEHVIPFLKAIYFLCYKYSRIDPEAFHLIVIVLCVGIIILTYKLTFLLTQSTPAALVGASIIAATNLFDEAIVVIANSHILFSLFFFLLLFYAMYQHSLKKKTSWRLTAFFAVLLLPSTFALGLTSLIFVVLFDRLCLSQEQRQNNKRLFPALTIAWLLSLLPYLYSIDAIIHAGHYQAVGARSVFEIMHFIAPILWLTKYTALNLIPSVTANSYLAFGLFFLSFFTAITRPKEIEWKKVVFFILFGLFNNYIIFVFRSAWGMAFLLSRPRYYVFPMAMIALCYAIILHPLFRNNPRIKNVPTLLLVYLLCFSAVTNGNLRRHANGQLFAQKTVAIKNFCILFKKAFVDYFHEHKVAGTLEVKNKTRIFARSTKHYAQYILPEEIYNKIIWKDCTDPAFLDYVKAKEYFFLID